MKIKFKHQKFQADAAKAVCDVFAGQPFQTPSYMIDRGVGQVAAGLSDTQDFTGFGNARIVPELNDGIVLEQIRKIQRVQQIEPSKSLEGLYNLTVEMETGVGKTYTYIKTMYELNKRYGWTKFIIVVPSVAIREGVYKSFQITEDHFAEDYGKKIRYFIYNSSQLTEIDRFASDSAINVMIINVQAFNARGKDARRISMRLDEFRSRRPIDILAKTNPIIIIDEPQSVEGPATKDRLREFNPLLTLRYSATHPKDRVYNMIYRLDAMEAYNKRLVKKIAVKGISESGSTATKGYVYLESINLSKGNPSATIEFDLKGAKGVRKVRRKVGEGYSLFAQSGELEEYRHGFTVLRIDGRDNSLEFSNGRKIFAGDVIGKVSEDQIRRIQIRETILSHLERERQLFHRGIKVLSLFFIDEVAKYKQYDQVGQAFNGEYADVFQEEYKQMFTNLQMELADEEYMNYLRSITVEDTHAGYFSIDKKSHRMIDSKVGDRREQTSDDSNAYDLIMKNKERLLDRREPVRFIFSHSALREGWDNPNVFQICTLKQSSSEVRKRQEVGRGLRLCVNGTGDRMDTEVLGQDVHNINVLTVIASESYDDFAKALQSEIAEVIGDRAKAINAELFVNKIVKDNSGNDVEIDRELATCIYEGLILNGYVRKGALTDEYYEDQKQGSIQLTEEALDIAEDVIRILDSIYQHSAMQPDNARRNNVELKVDDEKLHSQAFKKLWGHINARSVYVVDFEEEELIRKAVAALDRSLEVPKIIITVTMGVQADKIDKQEYLSGTGMLRSEHQGYEVKASPDNNVKYDLVGKIVSETGLTRKAVVKILQGMDKAKFSQFANNPEEFIIRASTIINEQKATVIIEHIAYDKMNAVYDTSIFTEPSIKGQLGVNAMQVSKHLYDYLVFDSKSERIFAEKIDTANEIEVYVKLPSGFYINTPVGKYNPDWAIAFHEGAVKHIYFVAETKGSMSSLQLRLVEEAKVHCAREHFKAISTNKVVYDVVNSYEKMLEKVMK